MTARDGGPWRGPTTEEWVERVARPATPLIEYREGRFVGWIDPRPATRSGQNDLAGTSGESRVAETASARSGSPDSSPPGRVRPAPSRRGPVPAAG